MPPSRPPLPTRVSHRIRPLSSGSSARATPDFWLISSARFPFARVTRIGDAPMSKSGPRCSPQPAPAQTMLKMSFSVSCLVHSSLPLSRSKARTASLVVDAHFPQQFPGGGVKGVGVCPRISEERAIALPLPRKRGDEDGGSRRRFRFKRPIPAPGLCVQRINVPVCAGHEDSSADHRGLSPRERSIGKCKSPLQFQLRHLVGRQASPVRGLKARVGQVGSPAIPVCARRRKRRLSVGARAF